MKTLVAFLLLTSTLLAEVSAVITGPTVARTGDLVVLSAKDAKGDNFSWIIPVSLQVMQCNADQDLGFASGTPGVYTFYLIAADKSAAIDHTSHTVTITGSGNLPDPPDEPGPTPALPLAELTKLSETLSSQANDDATAALIAKFIEQTAANIKAMCAANNCPTQTDAISAYQRTIGNALAQRPRGSQTNWVPWRKGTDEALRKLKIETLEQLEAVYLALGSGL